ncbi:MAG: transcription elongation factor subunit Spt4 [Candidatus Aenigmarchaeota archaeon]|nr:transcription elongation factor Spt4 [Candidatus Aenigmarchaeota archaeon]MDW8148985.1 transcription elongation factor subunit Spt4 [Candidatus Aenigmarchaeota archaeon]
MLRSLKACRNCRTLTDEKKCPNCNSSSLSSMWKGVAIIISVESEMAKKLNIQKPGIYAVYIE